MSDKRTRDELLTEITFLEEQNAHVTAEVSELEDEKQRLESELEDGNAPAQYVANFLDECERKVGERKFIIPDNPRVHDAIRAMADAIGRDV